MIGSLLKAAVAIVVTPVAIVVDVATLPASAEGNKHPFRRTGSLLNMAGENFIDAISPDNKKGN